MNMLLTCLNRLLLMLFVTTVLTGQLFGQESIEDYKFKYQKVTAELARLTLAQKRNSEMAYGRELSQEDKGRVQELQKDQRRLLDKLISLSPENEEFRFELAKMFAGRGEQDKAFEILSELAPLDASGYPLAHFVLAKQYFSKDATGEEKQANLNVALQHVDHVLTRNVGDLTTKLLKAKILTSLQRSEDAYRLYEELFEANPGYFREMAELNKSMGREDRNEALYENALAIFLKLADQDENQMDDRRWIMIQSGISDAHLKLGRHAEAESRLLEMIENGSKDSAGSARVIFLQRLLSNTYVDWANEIADARVSFDSLPPETLGTLLDLYTKARRYHRDNLVALQSLARLTLTPNAKIADAAKAVYDPNLDEDAPAAVLNQLGNHALITKNFSDAIRQYERAREKSPDDPGVLNNLAYAYLVATDDGRNPDRALRLINEAIRNLPDEIIPVEMSKFLHTKATALKQLDRIEEAIRVYEEALQSRPQHVDTLKSLIECFQALDKLPPEIYVSRLAGIEKR